MMKAKILLILVAALAAGIFLFGGAQEEWTPTVVVSEVAWMGTQASAHDEWVELYNATDEDIDISGWTLTWDEEKESPNVIQFPAPEEGEEETAGSVIPAHGFYVLERTDDDTISDIEADLIYTGALGNSGEKMVLYDGDGNIIDVVDATEGWPAGDNSTKSTMERIDPLAKDSADNWATNDGQTINGLDADDSPINGTPGQPNSMSE